MPAIFKRARAILGAHPTDAHGLYLLAECQRAFGDVPGAMANAQRAVDLEPRNATYRLEIAAAYAEKAQRASAWSALSAARAAKSEAETALRLDPKHPGALRFLVEYCSAAPGIAGGSKDKAAKYAEQLAAVDAALGWLARAHLAREPARIEECYRKALAQLHWQQKNYTSAEAEARAAAALQPDRIGAYNTLARALADAGRTAELESALAAAERAVPDNLSPYDFAARRTLAAGGDATRATAWLRKYLAQEPEGDAPSAAMAQAQLRLASERLAGHR
jgi:tetratricopeptide (TPR) repeat protein